MGESTHGRRLTALVWALRTVYLLLLVYAVYFVYRPAPIARALIRTFDMRPDPAAATSTDGPTTLEVEQFQDSVATLPVYRLTRPDNRSDLLVVDIPGGAFIVSSTNLEPYKRMMNALRHDVVSINYPVLFEARARTAIEYLERALRHVIERHRERWRCTDVRVCLVGASAGAYYAAKIIDRGLFSGHITKFVGVSGYYGHAHTGNVLLKTLDRMYLTSLLPDASYACRPLPVSVHAMLVTGSRDFLRESTERYAAQNQMRPHVYEGDHRLFWTPGLDSARQLYEDMTLFMTEN